MYTNDNFPCLVQNGVQVEDPNTASDEHEKYQRIARNAFRHLTYGVPFIECKLLNWTSFSALFIKKDPQLLAALHDELQNIFNNAYQCLQSKQLDSAAEDRLEVFIKNLLAAYPYFEPANNDILTIPQKINGEWQAINFNCERIDISPQTGLLSKLVKDEDRLYAYGLVPQDPVAPSVKPYLVMMGSTYPAAQGADLDWLYNFTPNQSVGEGHDLTLLEAWIKQHQQVKVVGHSKGGTMAMILAAKNPEAVVEADCLNPTALAEETLKRLEPKWNALPADKRPKINVYTQTGDQVFYLEKRFLDGTDIYQIRDKAGPTDMLASHAHYMAGRKAVEITKLDNSAQQKNSMWRDFITFNKKALTWAIFPLLYAKMCITYGVRNIKDFCLDKLSAFESGAILTGTFASSLPAIIGFTLPFSICVLAGIVAAYLAYKSLEPGVKLTSTVVFSAMLSFAFISTIIAAALSYVVKVSPDLLKAAAAAIGIGANAKETAAGVAAGADAALAVTEKNNNNIADPNPTTKLLMNYLVPNKNENKNKDENEDEDEKQNESNTVDMDNLTKIIDMVSASAYSGSKPQVAIALPEISPSQQSSTALKM